MFSCMDHAAAADQTAPPALEAPDQALAGPHAPLDPDLVDQILASGRDARPGYEQREDGWTPERIAIFLNTLAEWGIVGNAAEAAGVTRQAAYALRNSAKGRAFQLAWRAALLLARRRLADDLMSRAINGQVDQLWRDGEPWRERRRQDNRLGLALLTRLDRIAAEADLDPAASIVADEFEQFVAIAADGGKGAADFVRHRSGFGGGRREAEALDRSENYLRYGGGHPREIHVSDIAADWQSSFTPEQIERGLRAGVLRKPRPGEGADDPVEPGLQRYVIDLPDLGPVGIVDV
jgi:hypothetical protein